MNRSSFVLTVGTGLILLIFGFVIGEMFDVRVTERGNVQAASEAAFEYGYGSSIQATPTPNMVLGGRQEIPFGTPTPASDRIPNQGDGPLGDGNSTGMDLTGQDSTSTRQELSTSTPTAAPTFFIVVDCSHQGVQVSCKKSAVQPPVGWSGIPSSPTAIGQFHVNVHCVWDGISPICDQADTDGLERMATPIPGPKDYPRVTNFVGGLCPLQVSSDAEVVLSADGALQKNYVYDCENQLVAIIYSRGASAATENGTPIALVAEGTPTPTDEWSYIATDTPSASDQVPPNPPAADSLKSELAVTPTP